MSRLLATNIELPPILPTFGIKTSFFTFVRSCPLRLTICCRPVGLSPGMQMQIVSSCWSLSCLVNHSMWSVKILKYAEIVLVGHSESITLSTLRWTPIKTNIKPFEYLLQPIGHDEKPTKFDLFLQLFGCHVHPSACSRPDGTKN